MNECQLHELGLLPYAEAWDLQERLAVEIAAGQRPPTLLLLEHPATFTFGRRGQAANLLWNEAECARRGIAVHWTDRGGDVTYHGPGQLVGYPLLPLGPVTPAGNGGLLPQADYVGYVRRLEAALILALARLGLVAGQVSGLTGVWVQPEVYARCPRCRPEERGRPAKLAAIGVKVDARGISRHGFALNVAPLPEDWQGIIACGLPDHPLVGLSDLLGEPPAMERVRAEVARAFGETFGFEMRPAALT